MQGRNVRDAVIDRGGSFPRDRIARHDGERLQLRYGMGQGERIAKRRMELLHSDEARPLRLVDAERDRFGLDLGFARTLGNQVIQVRRRVR